MYLDKTIPEIPQPIFSLALDDPDLTFHMRCEELWREVIEELCDDTYARRAHHNNGTYDQGCRGPLCRKALRDHSRRKSPSGLALIVREERVYDPVLEYFHTVMKFRIKNYQTQILEEIAQ
jgi:hypothetical protein